ncbi:MAG: 2-phospho-L-lactate guanylyltransferase [Gammaproteobacteria bacterium]|jgi:2-phospho-L-lactate guanylyltransferase|nr:2-phospho-L-lactate guanylyltransferase [Gammaproteobacteria bacterium]
MTVTASPVWAILPIKSLDGAKQRLRNILSPNERKELMLNSARDVLTALTRSSRLSGILLVSKDKNAVALGNEFGVRILKVGSDNGQSEAIEQAATFLREHGVTSTLTIPGDAPLLLAEDVDIVCDTLKKGPAITIVSNVDGTGSNCIGASPSNSIPYQFGTNSFTKHVASAYELGIEPKILSLPRLELDIDTVSDVSRLMKLASRTRTQKFIAKSGIVERYFATTPKPLPGNNLITGNEVMSR